MTNNDDVLEFYREHPDQAKSKLHLPANIKSLRNAYLTYVGNRNLGPKVILSDIQNRVQDWARDEYADHISKSLSISNLRDFKQSKSNLIIGSRLAVHVYIWTSSAAYRNDWGEFVVHQTPPPLLPERSSTNP